MSQAAAGLGGQQFSVTEMWCHAGLADISCQHARFDIKQCVVACLWWVMPSPQFAR